MSSTLLRCVTVLSAATFLLVVSAGQAAAQCSHSQQQQTRSRTQLTNTQQLGNTPQLTALSQNPLLLTGLQSQLSTPLLRTQALSTTGQSALQQQYAALQQQQYAALVAALQQQQQQQQQALAALLLQQQQNGTATQLAAR